MSVALGIEIGGTKLQAGVGTREGVLLSLAREEVQVARGAEGIRATLPTLIERALVSAGRQIGDVRGIGIGFGGPVDVQQGVTVLSNQIAGWENYPLRDWMHSLYHLPVVVENDAKTAGYAEALAGAGKGYSRVLYVTIGSGIGGGWILRGEIDTGQGLGATEIGHTWVPHPQDGAPAKLELVASGWSIGRRAREALARGNSSLMTEMVNGAWERVTAETVYTAAERGDQLALKLLDETTDALAIGLANAINLYHPERVILGGGVSLMGELFWQPLREKVHRRVFAPFAQGYELVPAALGEQVVVVGALLLAWNRTVPSDPA